MKFKMKLSNTVYALTGVVVAITVASIVINILILTNTGRFKNGNTAVTAVSLCCSVILGAACLLLALNSAYVFKDNDLKAVFGVYPISFPYDKIIAVAEEKISKKLFIQYSDAHAKDGFGILAININPARNDDFIAQLKKFNPSVKVDTPAQDDDSSAS